MKKDLIIWTIFSICMVMLGITAIQDNSIDEKTAYCQPKIEMTKEEQDYWFSPDPEDLGDQVLITWYNPCVSQCDSDPLITADMSKIDLKKLSRRDIRWIAVSRDLLNRGYSMGDTIIIDSPNPRINGEWVIHDKMNKRFTNRIDLLISAGDEYYQLKNPKMGTIKKI